MSSVSRTMRFAFAITVVLWGFLVLFNQVSPRFIRDPYDLPKPPYVSVTSFHAGDAAWRFWFEKACQNVVTFMRFAN